MILPFDTYETFSDIWIFKKKKALLVADDNKKKKKNILNNGIEQEFVIADDFPRNRNIKVFFFI